MSAVSQTFPAFVADKIIESLIEPLLVVDAELTITTANGAALKLFGFSGEGLIGRRVETLLARESFWFSDCLKQTLKSSGMIRQIDVRCQNRDGKKIPMSFSGSVILDAEGRVQGMVCLAQDMTERDALREELAFSHKMEAVGRLAAGIAHEINTPLQFIGDNAKFLAKEFENICELLGICQELAHAHEHSEISVVTLARLIDEIRKIDVEYLVAEIPLSLKQSLEGILRVSQIVHAMKNFTHQDRESRVPADLNAGIQATVIISRNEWKYVANLEIDLDPTLPLVPCCVDEINQVVLNMIVNSSHAIKEEIDRGRYKKGSIFIRTKVCGDQVKISITDDGAGIAPKIVQHIYDPFFTTKEVGQGTGQGLAIAHDIIANKHKGGIEVASEVGSGTTFTISLPLREVFLDAERTENLNTLRG